VVCGALEGPVELSRGVAGVDGRYTVLHEERGTTGVTVTRTVDTGGVTYTFTTEVTTTAGFGTGRTVTVLVGTTTGSGLAAGTTTGNRLGTGLVTAIPALPPSTPNPKNAATTSQPRR
jgi:hypothetical protein